MERGVKQQLFECWFCVDFLGKSSLEKWLKLLEEVKIQRIEKERSRTVFVSSMDIKATEQIGCHADWKVLSEGVATARGVYVCL